MGGRHSKNKKSAKKNPESRFSGLVHLPNDECAQSTGNSLLASKSLTIKCLALYETHNSTNPTSSKSSQPTSDSNPNTKMSVSTSGASASYTVSHSRKIPSKNTGVNKRPSKSARKNLDRRGKYVPSAPFLWECDDQAVGQPQPVNSNQAPDFWLNESFNVEGREDEPPKYEEVVKQTEAKREVLHNYKANEKVRLPNKQNNSKFASNEAKHVGEQAVAQNDVQKVEALNDLIKKQFGSVGSPIEDLSNVDMSDKPFPGRNRLFIRNLPLNTSRNDLEKLMSCYGEITVDFIDNEKGTCCIRVKQQAEAAQRRFNGYFYKGKPLRVHFDNREVRFKVLNLTPWVTNELLKKAFSIFGEVDCAEVFVDNDGFPTGEGYLEFAHKKGGERAYEACKEGCFLLTASLRPVILIKLKSNDCSRGISETKQIQRNPHYLKERQVGPRFVAEGSTEYKCALLWKDLVERRRVQLEEFEKKFREEEELTRTQVETLQKHEGKRSEACR